MNSSHTHDHEEEEQIFKKVKKYASQTTNLSVELNDLKAQMKKQIQNESYDIEDMESFMEKLPTIVIENIFKRLSHKSLFDVANDYPQFFFEILNPIYWRFIKIDFSDTLFNHVDALAIIMYLNLNLRRISFRGSKMGLRKERLNLYFDYMPNLTHLELGLVSDFSIDFIKIITEKLKNLVFISMCWNCKSLRDDHLRQLLSLKNLHSIDLSQCLHLSDSVILEFVKTVKKLVYFNIDGIEYVTDE